MATMQLRQVIDAVQGFIGIQQLHTDENGNQEWRWIETVTMAQIGLDRRAVEAGRLLAQ